MTESLACPDPSFLEDEHKNRDNSRTVDSKCPCDYCGDSRTLLYCRADSAKLCLKCDREVHSSNKLFSKHTRTQLCDACNDSPATIVCSTGSYVFCQNCDWERHGLSLSPVHERRPIEGFTGCPSVSELLAFVGLEDLSKKALVLTDDNGCYGGEIDGFIGSEFDGLSNLLDWDHAPPSVLSLDDLILSTNASHNYNAMEVPPLPKSSILASERESLMGTDEIFFTWLGYYFGIRIEGVASKKKKYLALRQLAKSEPQLNYGDDDDGIQKDTQAISRENLHESDLSIRFALESKADLLVSQEEEEFQFHIDNSEPGTHVFLPNASSRSYPKETSGESHTKGNTEGQSQLPVTSQNVPTVPKIAPYELSSLERDSAISRYKEKRKRRRFEKHIRYESRKLRAESRTRIKGRFAKIEH